MVKADLWLQTEERQGNDAKLISYKVNMEEKMDIAMCTSEVKFTIGYTSRNTVESMAPMSLRRKTSEDRVP